MKIEGNDPCYCGSGKKYRNCHKKKRDRGFVVAFVVIVFGGIFVAKFATDSPKGPPGPAPPGKVWSAEHQHWHDANGQEGPMFPAESQPAQVAGVPAPDGPAPEGKVWSAEHGHWHDIDPNDPSQNPAAQSQPAPPQPAAASGPPYPRPEGPIPDGKEWSTEHGHWHDIAAAPAGPPYPQPDGPVPEGKIWSEEHGHWHDAPKE
jgi:hypothetical protein